MLYLGVMWHKLNIVDQSGQIHSKSIHLAPVKFAYMEFCHVVTPVKFAYKAVLGVASVKCSYNSKAVLGGTSSVCLQQ